MTPTISIKKVSFNIKLKSHPPLSPLLAAVALTALGVNGSGAVQAQQDTMSFGL